MCGRYANTAGPADLSSLFDAADETGGTLAADYNIAPTRDVPVVLTRHDNDGVLARTLRLVRWGLVPSWAKDPSIGSKLINARAETVATKPAFRSAFASRRCLIPATGYYEWQVREGERRKQPWYIHSLDGDPLAFAGLYELWRDAEGLTLATCTIVTTSSAPDLPGLHDRSPVIIPAAAWGRWLEPGRGQFDDLLAPSAEGTLAAHTVSPDVGNVRNNSPALMEPWEAPAVLL